MYIRSLDGNLLRFEKTMENAKQWIVDNGYVIRRIDGNDIYVDYSDVWFIK